MENEIQDYFINALNPYKTLQEFYNAIDKRGTFRGHGKYETPSARYFLVMLDSKLYATQEAEFDKNYEFMGIYEVDPYFLESDTLRYGNYFFKDFDIDLLAEVTLYNYTQETVLRFKQRDKIELLYSIHLIKQQAFNPLEVKIYPSLEPVIKWSKMMKDLDERCANILAQKKKIEKE